MMPGQGWGNPVVGGVALRRPAVQSPNFVHNSTGWAINADGSAEFQNAIIKGTITAGTFAGSDFILNNNGFFVYSSTPALGNLIVSIAPVAGTDSFGNTYPQGINVTTGTISGATITGSVFNGTDFILNASGAFFYSATPANGKLIGSIASVNSTDAFGNGYLSGISNYVNNSGTVTTTNILNGTVWFYQGTVATPGTTQQGWLGTSGSGGLELLSGTGTTPFIISAPVQVSGNIVNLSDVLSSSPGAPAVGGSLWANSNGTVSAVNSAGQQGQLTMTQAQQGGVTNNTVNLNSLITTPFTIPANDAAAGTVYRVTCGGHGTMAATSQTTLVFQLFAFGLAWGNSIDNGNVPAGSTFHWRFAGELIMGTPSSSAPASFIGEMVISTAATSAQGHPTAMDQQRASGVNTTVSTNITFQAGWTSVTNSPTIVCTGAVFERIGALC